LELLEAQKQRFLQTKELDKLPNDALHRSIMIQNHRDNGMIFLSGKINLGLETGNYCLIPSSNISEESFAPNSLVHMRLT
jgi:hypothetical protein